MTAQGSGAPVLLLHGYLSNKESFYYQLLSLRQNGFYAVAPDMPGFGASAPITSAWSVSDYAEWVRQFVSVNNIYGANLVAHSFGARVAIKLAASDEKIFSKLILTGGAGLVKPRSPQYMRQVKRYRRIKKFLPRFAERHFGSAEYRTLPPVMRESYKLIVNEDLRECAKRIENPTLLIYGQDDTVTPPNEEGAVFRETIMDSRLEVIGGDHFCFCNNQNVFNNLMLDFFEVKQ